jgi:hypothetical protein
MQTRRINRDDALRAWSSVPGVSAWQGPRQALQDL